MRDAITCPGCNAERYEVTSEGLRTSRAKKCAAYFPLADHLRMLFDEYEHEMCKWYDDPSARLDHVLPDVMTDGWHSESWSNFLRTHGDSRWNVAISMALDGVQKSNLTQKNITPIMVKIDSLPPSLRYKLDFLHCVGIIPSGYANLDLYLSVPLQEIAVLCHRGLDVNLKDGTVQRVRVKLMKVEGDLRALPGIIGIWRDPSPTGCPDCTLLGERLGRTTRFKERASRALPKRAILSRASDDNGVGPDSIDDNDVPMVLPADGDQFKRCPILGAVLDDVITQSVYCYAHGVKNFNVTIFKILADVDEFRFSQRERQDQKIRFSDLATNPGRKPPWVINKEVRHNVLIPY